MNTMKGGFVMQWLSEETSWLIPEPEMLSGAALTPESLMQLGAGMAHAAPGCMIGSSEGGYARACAMQICSGAAAAGGAAVLLPECTAGELGTASLHTSCRVLAYCSENGVSLFSRGLLPLTAGQEQIIRSSSRQWMNRTEFGSITDGSALRQFYRNRLKARLPENMPARIRTETGLMRLKKLLDPLMHGGSGDCLTLQISRDGRRASVYSEKYGWFFYEKLLLMVSLVYLEQEDIALPYWLPQIAEHLAEKNGRQVFRYASHPDGGDTEARALAVRQGFTLDGVLLCADFLRFHAELRPNLIRWAKEIPDFCTVRRVLSADRAAKTATRCAAQMKTVRTPEGIRAEDERGTALLHPVRSGKTYSLMIEAANMELAQELAADLTAFDDSRIE